MYDLRAGEWGGGDLFEGGQNSIYTGWTNAPIALGLLQVTCERLRHPVKKAEGGE